MIETSPFCPGCGTEIREVLVDRQQFDCPNCGRQYRVLVDKTDGWTGMIPLHTSPAREPLGLPKGSIRAIATLTVAGCSWGLVVAGIDVPAHLLGLLLAIIGYYFGFRQKDRAAGGRVIDACTKPQEPLGLPGGTIRMMLIGGFAVSALILYSRGRLSSAVYIEFFLILAGLIAGHFFSRFFAATTGGRFGNLIVHLKGLIVLTATVGLAIVLMSDSRSEHAGLGLALACVISFYFGSR